jgi:hypothetical protein
MKNTLTTDLNARLSPQLFLAEVASVDYLHKALPAFLKKQAAQGYPKFCLTGEMISSLGVVRIVIEDPTVINSESISVKFRLTGILDTKTGEMIGQDASARGQSLEAGTAWLKGFKSNPGVLLTPESLAPEAWGALVQYAEFFNEVGSDAFYNEYTTRRLYLSPLSPTAQFQFLLQTRLNLSAQTQYSIGITSEGFSKGAFTVLGSGVSSASSVEELVAIPVPAAAQKLVTVAPQSGKPVAF